MQSNMKKAACAAALCMAMAVPFAGSAEDEIRVITCGTLNLRAAANTCSSVIGKYGWGTPVLVKGVNGDWAAVDVGGQSGYMYAKYLGAKPEKPARPEKPGKPTCAPATTAYVNTNGRGLNLRKTPGGAILASYPRGTQVTVLSTAHGWSKVSVCGKIGFMSSAWLSQTKPAASTPAVTPSKPAQQAAGIAVVNNPRDTQVLFLRAEPSQASASLGYYRNGKTVKLLEKTGDWYKVQVDGKTGYMMAAYLKVTSAIPAGSAKVFNPNGNSFVNFRKSASLNAAVLSTIPVGSTVKVLEKGTDWTKVQVNGTIGYISTWFLKF